MLDEILGEIGTLDPWLYRGWRYLLSRKYRAHRHEDWRSSSIAYVVWDVFASVAVMVIECVLAILLLRYIFGH